MALPESGNALSYLKHKAPSLSRRIPSEISALAGARQDILRQIAEKEAVLQKARKPDGQHGTTAKGVLSKRRPELEVLDLLLSSNAVFHARHLAGAIIREHGLGTEKTKELLSAARRLSDQKLPVAGTPVVPIVKPLLNGVALRILAHMKGHSRAFSPTELLSVSRVPHKVAVDQSLYALVEAGLLLQSLNASAYSQTKKGGRSAQYLHVNYKEKEIECLRKNLDWNILETASRTGFSMFDSKSSGRQFGAPKAIQARITRLLRAGLISVEQVSRSATTTGRWGRPHAHHFKAKLYRTTNLGREIVDLTSSSGFLSEEHRSLLRKLNTGGKKQKQEPERVLALATEFRNAAGARLKIVLETHDLETREIIRQYSEAGKVDKRRLRLLLASNLKTRMNYRIPIIPELEALREEVMEIKSV